MEWRVFAYRWSLIVHTPTLCKDGKGRGTRLQPERSTPALCKTGKGRGTRPCILQRCN